LRSWGLQGGLRAGQAPWEMGAGVGTGPPADPGPQGAESAAPEPGAALGLPPALPGGAGEGAAISGCRGDRGY